MLHKLDLHKPLRISAWILRFINNCRKNQKAGPLTTLDLVIQKKTLHSASIGEISYRKYPNLVSTKK